MNHAFSSAWGRFSHHQPFSFASLITILLVVYFGTSQYIPRIETGFLAVMVMLGFIIGWLLGWIPLPGWAAGVYCGSCSVWIPMFWIGRMDLPLREGVVRAFTWISHSFFWQPSDPDTPTSLSGALAHLVIIPMNAALRLEQWLQSIAEGNASFDPLAASLAWSIVFFAIGVMAGWVLRVHNRGLIACLPAIALLSAVLYYFKGDSWYIYAVFAMLLTLLVIEPHMERRFQWERAGTDYSDRFSYDVVASVAPWIIMLLVGTAILPQLDLTNLSRQIRETWDHPPVVQRGGLDASGGLTGELSGTAENGIRNSLSKNLSLGTGPNLSQALIMVVLIDSGSGEPFRSDRRATHYWRSDIYDTYYGSGWTNSSSGQLDIAPNVPLQNKKPNGSELTQHVRKYARAEREVFYSGILYAVDQPVTVVQRSDEDIFLALSPGSEYTAISYESNATEADLRAAGSNYPQWIRARYLALPADSPRRISSLAKDWTAAAITPYDQALAIQDHLRKYEYALDIPLAPANRDAVDYFLFDQQKGFCNYFASAMVLLARASGIPARLVTGYAAGSFDPIRGSYTVIAADAHAWPELYFEGVGWVEFEPTPIYGKIARDAIKANPESGGPFLKFQNQWTSSLPGFSSIASLTATTLILTMSLLILIGILQYWFLLVRLHFLQPEKALSMMFRSVVRQGKSLGLPFTPGTTVDEFTDQLRKFQVTHMPMQDSLVYQHLMETYSNVTYGSTSISKKEYAHIYKSWKILDLHLRWQTMKSMIHRTLRRTR
jgi:transglutaminase-like putative cysteine protease